MQEINMWSGGETRFDFEITGNDNFITSYIVYMNLKYENGRYVMEVNHGSGIIKILLPPYPEQVQPKDNKEDKRKFII